MELQITARNLDMLPEVRSYIERKIGKLGRHLPNIMETKVEILEEKTKSPHQRFVVQITFNCNGTLLRGEERGEGLLAAIDKAAAVMDRQIERYKGKLYDKGKGISLSRGEFTESVEQASLPQEPVKVKRFAVKPCLVAEAIDQMELLGHDFYLFFNVDTGELNLLYRRKDGKYGLIETELG